MVGNQKNKLERMKGIESIRSRLPISIKMKIFRMVIEDNEGR